MDYHENSCRTNIAILVPRHLGYEFSTALLSTWCLNSSAVILSPEDPVQRTFNLVKDSEANAVLYHPSLQSQIQSLASKLSEVEWIPITDITAENSVSKATVPTNSVQKLSGSISDNNNVLMIYTSGTTGTPKGVLWSREGLISSMESMIHAWKWTSEDRIYHTLPLHHVHGLVNILLTSLWSGAFCEFSPSSKKFDPLHIWKKWMDPRSRFTLFMAVPTIYKRLIDCFEEMSPQEQEMARASCQQFRLFVSGSSALPQPVFDKWEDISSQKLLERYGMTETGMVLGNPLSGPRMPGEVGNPFPGVQVKLVDDHWKDLPNTPGLPGRLLVKSPQLFSGYWKRDAKTRASFSSDGWFITGDVAAKTGSGTFKILGRESADIIKSRGYKISALEIEREILSMSEISEVAVFGIPSDKYGETILAMIVPKISKESGKRFDVSLEMIQNHVQHTLPQYKWPQRLKIVDEIPKNHMGKVNKKQLMPTLM